MEKITPEQALNNLYQASTLAKLSAQEHQVLLESAKVLQEIIKPKEKTKNEK
jgi:hypothetical protein